MDYYKFQITCETGLSEILIALMSDLPFDTFQENEQGFEAFLPASDYDSSVEDTLDELSSDFKFNFAKEFIPGQNWNEIWESNFHPVIIDDFCGIRADFHQSLQHVEYELVINPKMAFGTGHHETTHMVIQLMRDLPFKGKRVFDFGCGTGVLAILASKLGAAAIDALDIEKESFENTNENCALNEVSNVQAYCGSISEVPAKRYDIILANINRNVILESLPSLTERMKPGSWLVCSGFITDDELLMCESLSYAGLQVDLVTKRGQWLSIKSRKL